MSKKWEYKYLESMDSTYDTYYLNIEGERGWRFTGFARQSGACTDFLMRRKLPKAPKSETNIFGETGWLNGHRHKDGDLVMYKDREFMFDEMRNVFVFTGNVVDNG